MAGAVTSNLFTGIEDKNSQCAHKYSSDPVVFLSVLILPYVQGNVESDYNVCFSISVRNNLLIFIQHWVKV